jgi:hypothetical protein
MKINYTLALFSALLTLGLAPRAVQAQNTAYGPGTLTFNTTGFENAAFGGNAMTFNTSGRSNTAIGYYSLEYNTTGDYNSALGAQSLYSNISGTSNVAAGWNAAYNNTTGSFNVGIGVQAMEINQGGSSNVAVGYSALHDNGFGNFNVAVGTDALTRVGGSFNTGVGGATMYLNGSVAAENVAVGYGALYSINGNGNVAVGNGAGGVNCSYNISLGYFAGSSVNGGNYNIHIGNGGLAGDSGVIRIGNATDHTVAYVAGIHGSAVTAGAPVYIDANGQLGTITGLPTFGDIAVGGALFTLPGPVGTQPPYPSGPHHFTAVLRGRTTTSTPTVDLTVDGNTPATSGAGTNVLIPPNNTTWYYRITIVARSDSSASNPGSSHGFGRWGMIRNTGGVISISGGEGSDAAPYDAVAASWTAARNATLSGYLRYTVSQASTTFPSVEWTATVDVTSVAN